MIGRTGSARASWLLVLVGIIVAWLGHAPTVANAKSSRGSTNNWAVLVCTSRFWFNYRHMANALGMYRTVKRLGIPDDQIILMLADDAACNARNMFAGTVYSNANRHLDLYGEAVEVDYRGEEVSVENFLRLLTGRVEPSTPLSKRLNTDENSNVFIYMTGHGGEEFLKFQDYEEISAFDIADAFQQMWTKKRYNELFFMIDTCQANTMYSKFYSPNIIATGCSEKGENSYSHHADSDIGVAVIDRYTHFVLNFLENVNKTSNVPLKALFDAYSFEEMHSNPGVRLDLFQSRPFEEVLIADFFGAVKDVEVTELDQSPHSLIGDLAITDSDDDGASVPRHDERTRRPGLPDGSESTSASPAATADEESHRTADRSNRALVILASLAGLHLAGRYLGKAHS